jgi:hypothetical protein
MLTSDRDARLPCVGKPTNPLAGAEPPELDRGRRAGVLPPPALGFSNLPRSLLLGVCCTQISESCQRPGSIRSALRLAELLNLNMISSLPSKRSM